MLPLTPAEESLQIALPHRRMENWQWTDLRQRLNQPYPLLQLPIVNEEVEALLAASPVAGLNWPRLVFVNGQLAPSFSTYENGDIQSSLVLEDPLFVMNRKRAGVEGAKLKLTGQHSLPIALIFLNLSGPVRQIFTKNIIELAPNASAQLVEVHLGQGDYLANSVMEIKLASGASFQRIKLECESAEAVHLSVLHASLEKSAHFSDATFTVGAKLNRQNDYVVLAGEEAEAKISGAYLLNARQHADTRLVVDHQVPRCLSRELFKCVMSDEARGIFQGKVMVRKNAQKTDGKQSSHALLLSPRAEFDAKPELEIFADDVVCGHGTTCGDINPDHLFYLISRGIPFLEARALLVAAFAGEVFEQIENDILYSWLVKFTENWLMQERQASHV